MSYFWVVFFVVALVVEIFRQNYKYDRNQISEHERKKCVMSLSLCLWLLIVAAPMILAKELFDAFGFRYSTLPALFCAVIASLFVLTIAAIAKDVYPGCGPRRQINP